MGQGLLIYEVSNHTQRRATFGRTPMNEWSARRRDLYLTTHNTHNRQISMPPVRFDPTVSASGRPQTHALDRQLSLNSTNNLPNYTKHIIIQSTANCLIGLNNIKLSIYWLSLTLQQAMSAWHRVIRSSQPSCLNLQTTFLREFYISVSVHHKSTGCPTS